MTDDEKVSAITKLMNEKIKTAEAELFARNNFKLAAMTERERRDWMKANGAYPGPHYDATYHENADEWWKRYEAKNPIGQDDYP